MTKVRCTPVGAAATVPVSANPRLLELLDALAAEKRLRILEALSESEACVCELQEELGMAQSLLSHHLRVLREAGLVGDRREGRWIHYSLVREALHEAEEGLASLRSVPESPRQRHTTCCAPSLSWRARLDRDLFHTWMDDLMDLSAPTHLTPSVGKSPRITLTLRVYDPALCCSTGVCGPDVDPEMVRFAADLEWLKGEGVAVERFNLAQQPAAFVAEPLVRKVLQERGESGLPLVIVDGEVRSSGTYPSRDLLEAWVGLGAVSATWDERVAELVAIGAAIASNCVSCLTAHELTARTLGVSRADIRRAVEMGRAVREASSARVEQQATRLLERHGVRLSQAEAPSARCGPSAGADGSSCC